MYKRCTQMNSSASAYACSREKLPRYIIGLGDIFYIISIIKNSKDIWDQDLRMQELGAQAIGIPEMKL